MEFKEETDSGKTFVFLIRHGHFNMPQGPHKFDPHHPLTEKGIKQARQVASKLKKIKDHIDIFICSSQKRALQTALEIGKAINKKPTETQDFWEIGNLLWSRKYYHWKYWKYFFRHKKIIDSFNKILKENQGKVILIVAHANVIKGIVGNKLKISKSKLKPLEYHNCHITLMRFNKAKLEKLYYFNNANLSPLNASG
ncbi:TPA: hypothetical protein ENS27_05780 [bacterium]|nr:hypothetical protein [bacterium]